MKEIVVALKPEARGLPLAAYHARFLAERLDARLTIVSCVFDTQVATGLARGAAAAAADQRRRMEEERQRLESLARSLRDWGARVEVSVVWDYPVHDGILREAERRRAELLVCGAHGRRGRPHTRFADVDWQLMRLSRCPLLLVKDLHFEDYDVVAAAVDPLHPQAEPAGRDRNVLDTADLLRRAFGAALWVVHAYPDPENFEWVSAVEVSPGLYYGAENIEPVHREAVERLAAGRGVEPAQVVLRPGRPIDVITSVVEDLGAKLLVIGAAKRGAFEQAMLGSTAEAVAADVGCDVLFVKAAAAS